MNELPPPCANGCGRPVRARGTTAADYPTTRTWLVKARGMCRRCYMTKVERVRTPRPPACVKCARPLRGSKDTLEKHPGTVRHVGNGVCDSCRKGATAQKAKRPEVCLCCHAPLRSRNVPEEEAPGTKIHDARGVCTGCRGGIRRGTIEPPSPDAVAPAPVAVEPKLLPEITDPGALRFRREREQRRRKAERIAAARREAEAVRRRFIATRKGVAA